MVWALAGPLSSTQRELWAVLTQKQLPNTLAAANAAEAGLNSETSTLMRNLMAQSGGNGTQLTIANAVWTNKTSVLKPYSDSMMKLFQASKDMHQVAAAHATCWCLC
jgi:serine protease inhibitor